MIGISKASASSSKCIAAEDFCAQEAYLKRNIISIDEEKCNGCGLCASACHEGALRMVGGKARLITDSYCDGLGACLPECPTGAITIGEREADPFDEIAVKAHLSAAHLSAARPEKAAPEPAVPDKTACGCPGTHARTILRKTAAPVRVHHADVQAPLESQLRQWPVQIKLVPVKAPWLQNANLLVAADCTAFACANIHNDYMKNRITLIGCPKLDEGDYSDKLAAILENNTIKSVTVLRMEVPCCGGIANAVKTALVRSGRMIPWQVVTIGTNGEILQD
jgi:ferredoxin